MSDETTDPLNHEQAGLIIKGGKEIEKVAQKVIKQIIKAIRNKIKSDKEFRRNFTQRTVDQISQAHPDKSVIMVHTKHHFISGGENTQHQHVETKQLLGGTIGYEIYLIARGKKTVFQLDGDGDYINWAIQGYFVRSGKGNKTVTFS